MGNGRHSGLHKGVKNTAIKDISHKTESMHIQLGERGRPLFERVPNVYDALEMVNPNYSPRNKDYSENCALCVTAAALQLMGYDVEAMPRDKEWRGFNNVFDYQWTPENFKSPLNEKLNYTGVPWGPNYANTNRFTAKRVNSMISEITSQMQTWGTHSFAAMNVSWKSSGAHVILVYQEKHRTTFMDFQEHKMYTPEQWFSKHPAKLNSIGLYRLDNQSLRENIKDLHKIVKKRGE